MDDGSEIHDDILDAVFSPLDAPFSPYSSGYNSVSDSSTHMMSPEYDNMSSGPTKGENGTLKQISEENDDDLQGFIDILDYDDTFFENVPFIPYSSMTQGANSGNTEPIAMNKSNALEYSRYQIDGNVEQSQLYSNRSEAPLQTDNYPGNIPPSPEAQIDSHIKLEPYIYSEHPPQSQHPGRFIDEALSHGPTLGERNCQQVHDPNQINTDPYSGINKEFEEDHLDIPSASNLASSSPTQFAGGNESKVQARLVTQFKPKYWRNDRKNLQCFPECPEFGDYYLMRIKNLSHQAAAGSTCSGSVIANVTGPEVGHMNLLVLSRINLLTSDGKCTTLEEGMILSSLEYTTLRKHSLPGQVKTVSGDRCDLRFSATCWKLTVELSKKRRPKDLPSSAPKYCFEVICLYPREDGTYKILATVLSDLFQIASTRTLAREIGAKTASQPLPSVKQASTSTKRTSEAIIYDNSVDTLIASDQDKPKKIRLEMGVQRVLDPESAQDETSSVLQQAVAPTIKPDSTLEGEDKPCDEQTSTSQNETQGSQQGTQLLKVPSDAHITPPRPSSEQTTVKEFGSQPKSSHNTNRPRFNSNVSEAQVAGHGEDTASHVDPESGTQVPAQRTEEDALEQQRQRPIPAIIVDDHFPEAPAYNPSTALKWALVLGLFGGHHYYLDRYGWGMAYTFTLGFLGIGWLYDLYRMDKLVDGINRHEHTRCTVGEAYMTWFPLGILGAHRYALGDFWWGVYYTCTAGGFGTAWLLDAFRMPFLYERHSRTRYQDGVNNMVNILDAYVLWFPGGIFGAHHYYLGDKKRFRLYLCTFGLLGLGWIYDGFVLKRLVNERRAVQVVEHTTAVQGAGIPEQDLEGGGESEVELQRVQI